MGTSTRRSNIYDTTNFLLFIILVILYVPINIWYLCLNAVCVLFAAVLPIENQMKVWGLFWQLLLEYFLASL